MESENGLNKLFKGKKVRKALGYGKSVKLKIMDIKENIHRYTNGQVAFKNYTVEFSNGTTEIFNSLNEIDFCKTIF